MIGFHAFSKRFGEIDAVQSLTLSVEPGEVVALLGPNGSGKTTSIKAAAGLIHPSAGSVTIGADAHPATDPSARAACSFLPQKVAFPERLTGREVVDFYAALRRVPADRIARAFAVTGLAAAAGRPVATYSGGMVQRLGLAVAMLPDVPLLLLDEPTAALDPDGLCAFYELIETRRRLGHAVFFSSHQIGDLERLADRFAVLVSGRLVSTFTARALTARLADRGVLKVALDEPGPDVLAAVRRLAPHATWAANQLIVPAPAASRLAVLDLLRESRSEIRGLTAEEGRLDGLYLELVRGRA
jgi:Cu-processing system ATP-binding protein